MPDSSVLLLANDLEPHHLFMEHAREIFFALDEEGVWTFLNPAWKRITGFELDGTLGTRCFRYVYPDDRQYSRNLFKSLTVGDSDACEGELRFVTQDNSICWFRITMRSIVPRSHREKSCVIGTLVEITDFKNAQATINLFQTLIQAITEAPDFNTALRVTLSQVCETTGWDYGEVWVEHAQKSLLQLSPVWYSKLESLNLFWQLSQSYHCSPSQEVVGGVWMARQALWIPDVSILSTQQFSRTYITQEVGLKSAFLTPIVASDQVLAVLVFFMFNPRREDQQLTELITAIAKQLGSVMQSKQAEDALRRAEEKYRSIFENAREGIFQVTPDGKYLGANPALAKIFGYETPEQLMQASMRPNWRTYVQPDRRSDFVSALSKQREISDFESQVYRQDGSLIWISERARVVLDQRGKLLYYEGTATDITERKQAEEALETTLSLLRATFDAIADGILATDCMGYLTSYNQKLVELWRIPREILLSDEERLQYCAKQLKDPEYFLQRVNEFHRQPNLEGFDWLELRDGRIFEQHARPQRLGESIVGRVWVYRDITERQQAEAALLEQQAQTEKLLLNILPVPIAERLRQNQICIADSFTEAGILFADIVNFSQLADRLVPTDLVELLNRIFSTFDLLTDDYGLEKIKTIGDAYLVASGLPIPQPDHLAAIVEMAIDMKDAIEQIRQITQLNFSMRIGIHVGPVVAGVIGLKKFTYDLWGDTVNIASRLEAHGLPDCIQVSEAVYSQLKDRYCFEQRGPILIKGKGEMITYLLKGKNP